MLLRRENGRGGRDNCVPTEHVSYYYSFQIAINFLLRFEKNKRSLIISTREKKNR